MSRSFLFAEIVGQLPDVALTWMLPHPERLDSQARQIHSERKLRFTQHGKEAIPPYSATREHLPVSHNDKRNETRRKRSRFVRLSPGYAGQFLRN
jgi:hypothetical protein